MNVDSSKTLTNECSFQNPLLEMVVSSASRLVSRMLELEIEEFISHYSRLCDHIGRPRIVRNGYLPERKLKTPLGNVPVRMPRVRDRLKGSNQDRIKFVSKIISPYQRRIHTRGQAVQDYLLNISSGDYMKAAQMLVGSRVDLVKLSTEQRWRSIVIEELQKCTHPVGEHFLYVWVDQLFRDEGKMSDCSHIKISLTVAVGETRWGEKILLFTIPGKNTDNGLYRSIFDKLRELGIMGNPIIALSSGCW